MEIQQILFYGVVLGILAYIVYARYFKTKKNVDEPPVEKSLPADVDEPETELIKTTKED